jgi:hypothetical protein
MTHSGINKIQDHNHRHCFLGTLNYASDTSLSSEQLSLSCHVLGHMACYGFIPSVQWSSSLAC